MEEFYSESENTNMNEHNDRKHCIVLALIEELSQRFVENRSTEKFHIGELIRSLIQHCSRLEKQEILQSNWIASIRDELFSLYQNRLNQELKDYVIALTAELTIKCKLDWIKLTEWKEKNSKFFFLLLKIISIEIEIILIECSRQKLEPSVVKNSSNKTTIDDDWLDERFPSCLVIYETIIETLLQQVDIENGDIDKVLKLSPEEIISSIETVNHTASRMIEYLTLLTDNPKLFNDRLSISSAIIRFICFYASEETELFRPQIMEIIPFLKQLLKDTRSEIQLVRDQILTVISYYE